MTDNKRNSVSTRVATPKATSTPSQADTLEGLSKAIGGRVKLTTAGPNAQALEGSLFTACPVLNVVAIDTRSAQAGAQIGDYHIIPVSCIQNFELLSLTNGSNVASSQPPIGAVNAKRVQERLEARIKKLKEDDSTRGKGVTKQGQAIFDALKRVNIPIRWHDQQMIVHEAVIISPPYRPEDCKGSKEKQQVVNQVRKVLEGETRKLKEKEERERKTATSPGAQRKGG